MWSRGTHPDITAARVIGIGAGLIALMVTWLVGNRLFGAFIESPTGPIVAFATAVAVGVITALVAGRRLAATAARALSQHD
jgi:hypothetical protein